MKAKTVKTAHGTLRVWHIPQVPGKPFHVAVASLVEAKLILDALADYDCFQYAHNIKPDYSNAAGLSVFDINDQEDGKAGSWVDWHSVHGEDFDFYSLEMLRKDEPTWEGV
jgi:hypothetical protein